ncbi:MAG: DNA helicase RecQ [Oscillospiraceae bacterium]|nr:DNA helicase RecQ [Oscillospiraceae bacterium]
MTPQEVLQQYFGYDTFRKGQAELIGAILSGRDVLGIMPTGAGKSVCYQVPAMLLPGLTVVISPLISLMHDQVRALRENGIPAAYLNSALDEMAYRQTLAAVYNGGVRILYAAPERLETESFARIAAEVPISMVTVDEAHCVSQWGQDFRPSYLKIVNFLQMLPRRPLLSAFTATATKEVAEDIVRILGLHDPYSVTTGFDRENLYFGVQQPRDKFRALMEILQEHEGESGIVYCLTRKLVEEVTDKLNENGFHARRYHAGLPDAERAQNQDDFLYDRVPVIVATNAFGMGIDKSNVSFVVHYNMPKNLENYYQEAGRAGRDGSRADCILLYAPGDVRTNQFMIEKSNDNDQLDELTRTRLREKEQERLKLMTFYCTRHECLRNYMLRYFGENAHNFCGNCSSCRANYEPRDITVEAQKIISCIYRLHQRNLHFGVTSIIEILRGSKSERYEKFHFADTLSTFGIMADVPEKQCREIVDFLLMENYISKTDGEYPSLTLNRKSAQFLKDHPKLIMNIVKEEQPSSRRAERNLPDDVNAELLAILKAECAAAAKKEGVPSYIIFTNAALQDMARKIPTTEMAFLAVSGVGRVKLEKYGTRFLRVIRDFKADHMKGNS